MAYAVSPAYRIMLGNGSSLRFAVVIATVVLLIAVAAQIGWLTQTPILVQPIDGPVIVFNTALCLALMALAVIVDNPASLPKIRIQQGLSSIVILVAGAVLSQHLFDVNIGLDWPSLHRWLVTDNPYPGRMSKPTALALMLCGAAIMLMHSVRSFHLGLVVQILTIIPALISASALAGLLLELRFVYSDYLLAEMSAPTAVNVVAISIALCLRWRRAAWYRSRNILKNEGQRIGLSGALILALITTCAVLAGAGTAKHDIEATISDGLLQVLKSNVAMVIINVDQRIGRASAISNQPRVGEYLEEIKSSNDQREAMGRLAEIAGSFLPLGFSGVAFLNESGKEVLREGQFNEQPEWSVQLKLPFTPILHWADGGFVLTTRLPILKSGKIIGTVLAEQQLTALNIALSNIETLGQTSELGICKMQDNKFHCIPQRFMPKVYQLPYSKSLPMSRAVAGETGVFRTRDYRHQNVIAAHGPIGDLGFGMVVKVDTFELYRPIREYLNVAMLLSLLMSIGGGLVLYARLKPLVGEIELSRETIREHGARALRVSEDRYAGIITSAMDAIIAVDQKRCILLFNKSAESMFQYTATQVIGRPLDMLLPLRYRAAHEQHIRNFSQSGVTTREMGRLGTISGLRANGDEFPIEASISQTGADQVKVFTVIMRDITERKQAESALRDLSRRLLEVEEAERRAISRELHDRIGQDLSAIKLTVDLMDMQLSGEMREVLQSRLTDLNALAQSSLDHTRDIMADLHPAGLEDTGLAAALQYHAERISQRSLLTFTVNAGWRDPRPTPASELALFRIAQEAINNIVKHADARNIRIDLEEDAAKNRLILRISDDGRGFDTAASRPQNHGLRTMRERAQGVGATMRVDSVPDNGTRIIVELPMRAA